MDTSDNSLCRVVFVHFATLHTLLFFIITCGTSFTFIYFSADIPSKIFKSTAKILVTVSLNNKQMLSKNEKPTQQARDQGRGKI